MLGLNGKSGSSRNVNGQNGGTDTSGLHIAVLFFFPGARGNTSITTTEIENLWETINYIGRPFSANIEKKRLTRFYLKIMGLNNRKPFLAHTGSLWPTQLFRCKS